jgi:hypothetical protein
MEREPVDVSQIFGAGLNTVLSEQIDHTIAFPLPLPPSEASLRTR